MSARNRVTAARVRCSARGPRISDASQHVPDIRGGGWIRENPVRPDEMRAEYAIRPSSISTLNPLVGSATRVPVGCLSGLRAEFEALLARLLFGQADGGERRARRRVRRGQKRA